MIKCKYEYVFDTEDAEARRRGHATGVAYGNTRAEIASNILKFYNDVDFEDAICDFVSMTLEEIPSLDKLSVEEQYCRYEDI